MREVHPIWTRLYKVGFSMDEIADAYKCSKGVVRRFLVSQGVKIKTKSQANYAGRLLNFKKYINCGSKKGSKVAIKTGKKIQKTIVDKFFEGLDSTKK